MPLILLPTSLGRHNANARYRLEDSLPLLFGQADSASLCLSRALPQDPQRPAFEAFIQQRFRIAHGADIRHFMPQLFGVSQANGELCAVAGVRLASDESCSWSATSTIRSSR